MKTMDKMYVVENHTCYLRRGNILLQDVAKVIKSIK